MLLVDARNGVVTQTRRHSFIVSLLGLKHVVVAVNKMDLVDWSQEVFETIAADYRTFAGQLGIEHVTCVPVSALKGDNVSQPSIHMPWYEGPTLLGQLESLEVQSDAVARPFRMAVQWVNRPHLDFRGYSGTIAGGTVKPGDTVAILPGGQTTTVTRIVTYDGDLDEAIAGQAVTLTLADEIDISRGDVIAAATNRPEVADQFAAHLVWMSEAPLLPGRPYILRTGTTSVGAQVTELKYAINVNTLEHTAAKHLDLNTVAVCNLALDRPIPFDPYKENRETGGFILVDRLTNATVGCGMIDFALRRASNIHWQQMKVDKAVRAAAKASGPACCGSRACRVRASHRWPTWWSRSCTAATATP